MSNHHLLCGQRVLLPSLAGGVRPLHDGQEVGKNTNDEKAHGGGERPPAARRCATAGRWPHAPGPSQDVGVWAAKRFGAQKTHAHNPATARAGACRDHVEAV